MLSLWSNRVSTIQSKKHIEFAGRAESSGSCIAQLYPKPMQEQNDKWVNGIEQELPYTAIFLPWGNIWGKSAMFGNMYWQIMKGYVRGLCCVFFHVGTDETHVMAQLTHTPLFVPFRTGYGKYRFTLNLSPWWETKENGRIVTLGNQIWYGISSKYLLWSKWGHNTALMIMRRCHFYSYNLVLSFLTYCVIS